MRIVRLITSLFKITSLLLVLLPVGVNAQTDYPQNYFGSPLEIPLYLSGNFGELRTNHFHAGLDIKTEQREGLRVLASADGYVSRIKVSPFGYGYALYITHPNGYTTVYGHLKKYAPEIHDFVKREQYKLQSFSVDLFPDSASLPIKKGQFIGWSGNSGGSGGPHLHFEVRETVSEKVINPLLFGFDIKDKIPPVINGIWIVPMNDSAFVNGGRIPVNYEAKGSGLKNPKPATVYGDFGFAIHTTDQLNGSSNRCGIYRIEFYVDSIQVYGQRMNKLDFTTNRAMNAHTIYERFKKNKSSIHGSYRLPGNPLDIYDNLVDDGIVSFRDGKTHMCEYRIIDFGGNKSSIKFKVQAESKSNGKVLKKKEPLAYWNWEEDNTIVNDDVQLSMKAFTLYEDLELNIERLKKLSNVVGSTYHIASSYEPVHNPFDLAIRVDPPSNVSSKNLLVVRYDPDKEKIISEFSQYKDGWLTCHPHYLGYFAVMVDTIPPSISSLNFGPNMNSRTEFSMSISDDLSGVDQIIPKIDGRWALMEFDAKSARLTYYFDSNYIEHGQHEFELLVIDAVGNEKKFFGKFSY